MECVHHCKNLTPCTGNTFTSESKDASKPLQWSRNHSKLFALDALVNAVIVTPLCVALWWIVWDLLYNLAYMVDSDANPDIGLWILIMVGGSGKFAMYLLQFYITPYFNPEERSRLFIVTILRVEMYIMFVLGMAVWVGVWTLLDELTGINGISTMVCLAVSLPGLFILRTLNCSVAAPMNLKLDSNQTPLYYQSRFMINPHNNQNNARRFFLYMIDWVITVPVIESLRIAYWRAGFNILDLYLLPKDQKLSAWITIIIGYSMFLVFLFLQFPAVRISKKLTSPWQRLLWKAGYWIVAFIMMVCIWRGIWNALNLYLPVETLSYPFNYIVPFIVHIGLVAIMFSLNIFNNDVPGFGVVDDDCLDGRDLLTMNILPTVSVSMIREL